MKFRSPFSPPRLLLAFATSSFLFVGACETDTPTTARVENALRSPSDGQALTVYRVWYESTLFLGPLAQDELSEPQRIVPGESFAYALVVVDWEGPETGEPTKWLALRSSKKIAAERGESVTLKISDELFSGNCFSGKQLDQAGADFIVERIFPGPFAELSYDASTCATSPRDGEMGGAGGQMGDQAGAGG